MNPATSKKQMFGQGEHESCTKVSFPAAKCVVASRSQGGSPLQSFLHQQPTPKPRVTRLPNEKHVPPFTPTMCSPRTNPVKQRHSVLSIVFLPRMVHKPCHVMGLCKEEKSKLWQICMKNGNLGSVLALARFSQGQIPSSKDTVCFPLCFFQE